MEARKNASLNYILLDVRLSRTPMFRHVPTEFGLVASTLFCCLTFQKLRARFKKATRIEISVFWCLQGSLFPEVSTCGRWTANCRAGLMLQATHTKDLEICDVDFCRRLKSILQFWMSCKVMVTVSQTFFNHIGIMMYSGPL